MSRPADPTGSLSIRMREGSAAEHADLRFWVGEDWRRVVSHVCAAFAHNQTVLAELGAATPRFAPADR